jgi:hypothetical protein
MVDFLILGLAGICLGTIAKLSDKTFGMPGYIYTIIAVCKFRYTLVFTHTKMLLILTSATTMRAALLCKIAALRSFSLERLQYFRERESGMSSLAYFLARDTIDHFSTVVKPIIYLSMFYYFNNPRSTIADNYIVLLALVYCVTGIGYTFAICFSPGSAQLVGILTNQFLFFYLIQETVHLTSFILMPCQCSALVPVVLTLLATQKSTPTFIKRLCYSKWALEGFIIVNAKK